MGFQSQVPEAARRFFEFRLGRRNFSHPVVAEVFHPDRGWKKFPMKKRVSGNWLRWAREEGFTHVALVSDGAGPADFSVRELLSTRAADNRWDAKVFADDWRGR